MALQPGATREAFLAAGAPADKASAAAEELAGYDNRIAGVETRLAVLTWMVGANVALTLIVIGSLFALWSKPGDITGQLAQLARVTH
jgi:type VI protein secretion system component VasF